MSPEPTFPSVDPVDAPPAAQWFTYERGGKTGPFRLDEIRRRVNSREVSGDTLIWSEGMPGWRPIRGFKAFWPPETVSPEILPQRSEPIETRRSLGQLPLTIEQRARPWHRWGAKLIDGFAAGGILGAILGALGLSEVLENSAAMALLGTLFLGFFLEPACLIAGIRTPGKSLYQISLNTADGSNLDANTIFRRSIAAALRGLGAGIPLVYLFTMIRQYNKLLGTGSTTYDAQFGVVVTHGKISATRGLMILLTFVAVLSLIVVGLTDPS